MKILRDRIATHLVALNNAKDRPSVTAAYQ
jgi:hypothetical protein